MSKRKPDNAGPLLLLLEILDVVLEDEQVRLVLAGQPDERLVVILDGADHIFSVRQLDPNGRGIRDQFLEVAGLFERLFRSAPGFSALLCRTLLLPAFLFAIG